MPGQGVGSFRSINAIEGKKEEIEKAGEVELTPKTRYPMPPKQREVKAGSEHHDSTASPRLEIDFAKEAEIPVRESGFSTWGDGRKPRPSASHLAGGNKEVIKQRETAPIGKFMPIGWRICLSSIP
jgi:hypothetical protein